MDIAVYLTWAVFLALYALPAIVAVARKAEHAWAIAALSLALGWTIAGWAIALIWSATVPRRSEEPKDWDLLAPLSMPEERGICGYHWWRQKQNMQAEQSQHEAQLLGALAYETLHASLGDFHACPWNELPDNEAKVWMIVGMAVMDFVVLHEFDNNQLIQFLDQFLVKTHTVIWNEDVIRSAVLHVLRDGKKDRIRSLVWPHTEWSLAFERDDEPGVRTSRQLDDIGEVPQAGAAAVGRT